MCFGCKLQWSAKWRCPKGKGQKRCHSHQHKQLALSTTPERSFPFSQLQQELSIILVASVNSCHCYWWELKKFLNRPWTTFLPGSESHRYRAWDNDGNLIDLPWPLLTLARGHHHPSNRELLCTEYRVSHCCSRLNGFSYSTCDPS